MTDATQRRLAAIVAADVVGYSRLMGADETGTLTALRRHRAELIDPALARHGGRIVKTLGDGLLLEFPSVVEATGFSVGVQQAMVDRNAGLLDDRAMRFRVGIHLGDVIIEGDDIFGNGVNVAARIEGLSRVGGVCLSDDAYRMVRDRLEIAWTDGGEHQVKNITRPVHVWHWEPEAAAPATPAPEVPDKPSVAILPFDNMSGDPEQEFFADGMTEDLITDLSKVSGLMVVARNSTFVFKGQAVDVREAARKLGVRYVVEGSVRKAGTRVRINVQLIDAQSGGHMWAERYDGSIDDVFELQDEVGAKVIEALSVHLRGDESARLARVHTQNLEAYELFVRAKATPYPPIPERMALASQMFQQVIDMDPDFAGGHAGLAWVTGIQAIFAHADPVVTGARAEELARRGIAVDDSFGWSYVALAVALQLQGRNDEANANVAAAIERQPNDSDSYAFKGLMLAFQGRAAEAVAPIDHALRLNPQFVQGPYLNLKSIIHLIAGQNEEAIAAFELNVARYGLVGPPALTWMVAPYMALGRHDDAARLVETLRTRFPAFRLEGWAFLDLIHPAERRAEIRAAIIEAGVPE